MKKDDAVYFEHILESIINIENSIKRLSKTDFMKEVDVQDAQS